MADKYSTIQQHQPLRVPNGWGKQERMLIVQLDEILDDIYKRFGRIKLTDMSKEFRAEVADLEETAANAVTQAELTVAETEIKAEATQYVDGQLVNYSTTTQTASQISTAIGNALGDYYTKTETASQISTSIGNALGDYYTKTETATQISTSISSSLGNYYTKTETASQISTSLSTALGDYYTKTETATQISTSISSSLGNYYTKTETASQISSALSTALGDYSTTSQTASAISAAVADCYGKQSGITITSSGVDVSGSKHINLDVNASNYVHINSSGIEMNGSRVSINGDDMWARDDIIVMNSNSSVTWRRTVSDIESHMSGKHDWVMVRPFYSASINYNYGQSYSARSQSGSSIVQAAQEGGGATSLGSSASWYKYTISGKASIPSGETQGTGTFTLELGNSSGSLPVSFTGQVTVYGGNVVDFSFNSGNISTNLCAEGAVLYFRLSSNYVRNVTDIVITCECDATTSRVPCTVYYYP